MLALLVGGCAAGFPNERGERLEQRVERIEGESPGAQLAAEATKLREQSRRVDATLGEVKTRLQELDAAAHAGAEPSARQRELAEELKRLRTALDQVAQRLDSVEKTLAQTRRTARETAPEARRAPPERPARREAPETSQDKTGYLALAEEQERKGEKTAAREMYEQYATEYPTDPATAEVHFRLGELAFGERRYRDAIVEFGRVASEFPRSDKAPDALLRTAESLVQLDMTGDAATLLSEIPKRYPGTSAAARAKKRLAELPKASASPSK